MRLVKINRSTVFDAKPWLGLAWLRKLCYFAGDLQPALFLLEAAVIFLRKTVTENFKIKTKKRDQFLPIKSIKI